MDPKSFMKLAGIVAGLALTFACGGATSGGSLVDGDFEDGAEIRALSTTQAEDTDVTETDCKDGLDNDDDGFADNLDDDCGELVDCVEDADGDGYYVGLPTQRFGACDAGWRPMQPDFQAGDCLDDRFAGGFFVNRGRPEVCDNGVDDNCNGQTDEGCEDATVLCYQDADGDSYGRPGLVTVVGDSCDVAGYASRNNDCNDSTLDGAMQHPGRTEVCNGVDDNCNGQTDEGCTSVTCYVDADGDTWGTGAAQTFTGTSCPTGYANRTNDCDDTAGSGANRNPGRTEVCGNGVDDDCNSSTSDTCPTTGPEYCGNGVDDDGDGQIDEADCLEYEIEVCWKPENTTASRDVSGVDSISSFYFTGQAGGPISRGRSLGDNEYVCSCGEADDGTTITANLGYTTGVTGAASGTYASGGRTYYKQPSDPWFAGAWNGSCWDFVGGPCQADYQLTGTWGADRVCDGEMSGQVLSVSAVADVGAQTVAVRFTVPTGL